MTLARATPKRSRQVLPGFGLSASYTVAYLSLLVLVPLAALTVRALSIGPEAFWRAVSNSRALSAFAVSFGGALLASLIATVLGLLIAYTLERHPFPGRRFIDALIDLPFALPTAVAGITLTALFAPNGWIGALLAPLGIKVAYSFAGIVFALVFIGLPFAVRSVQPTLEALGRESEEAASSLGASAAQTFFRVLLPELFPALLAGFTLAFARTVGEYGSVIFISGNMPFKTEILPLLIVGKLEQFDYGGAAALALTMLLLSLALLLVANATQARAAARLGAK